MSAVRFGIVLLPLFMENFQRSLSSESPEFSVCVARTWEMIGRASPLDAVIVMEFVVWRVACNDVAWPEISATSSDFDTTTRFAARG